MPKRVQLIIPLRGATEDERLCLGAPASRRPVARIAVRTSGDAAFPVRGPRGRQDAGAPRRESRHEIASACQVPVPLAAESRPHNDNMTAVAEP
ncbi:MAG TPA: hypothetical protein VJO15_02220 [Dehalococcoidia bacterium]|nr:hypothetical protein [Dehalococcoidia bacterium]